MEQGTHEHLLKDPVGKLGGRGQKVSRSRVGWGKPKGVWVWCKGVKRRRGVLGEGAPGWNRGRGGVWHEVAQAGGGGGAQGCLV